MRLLIITFCLLFLVSCAGNSIKTDNGSSKSDIKTGWNDDDTYTVTVSAEDEKSAVEMAKHRILKDIVQVRMKNQSRYTDIAKIKGEFEKPLYNGRIISKKNISSGIKIFFQIKDKGLKKKFERK